MKRVLVIASPFPPVGGSGVQRTVKFVKYLPQYGWEPIVLTRKNPKALTYDHTLAHDLPQGLSVYRALNWFSHSWFRSRNSPSSTITKADTGNRRSVASTPRIVLSTFIQTARRWMRRLAIPDSHITWVIPAFRKGLSILRRHQIDVIYVTAPPHSSYLVGYLLNKATGIPFVVDFRDAWVLSPLRQTSPLDKFLEHKILSSTRKAIFASSAVRSDYEALYPDLSDRFQVITNGYDEDDFYGVVPRELPKFSIVYTGRIIPPIRNLSDFLTALEMVISEQVIDRQDLYLWFVGHVHPSEQQKIIRHGFADITQLLGDLPHREAIRYTLGADILLLIGSGDPAEIQGKIFEYLYASRPILAIVPRRSPVGQVIVETGHGVVAEWGDVEEIKHRLVELLARDAHSREMKPEPNNSAITKYSRQSLTGELAQILSEAIVDA